MTFSVCLRRSSSAGSGWPPAPATRRRRTPRACCRTTLRRCPRRRGQHSVGAGESARSGRRLCGGEHLGHRSARQCGARIALRDDLVAVHPHRCRVIGDAERQSAHRLAERIQRQRHDLAAVRPQRRPRRDGRPCTVRCRPRHRPARLRRRPPDPEQHAAVCQCAGSSTATRLSGPAPSSSRNRLPVLAAQLASVTADSSIRSPVASS